MEQIQVILYALLSFFGVENGRVGAEITTVTINPEKQVIEIVQENLFTVIKAQEDKAVVLEQLETVKNWESGDKTWIKDLSNFPEKTFTLRAKDGSIVPQITLKYADEKDLRNLGIWYNEDKNHFSINHIPRDHLKTEDGNLEGNYCIFNGEEEFTFTLEPFTELPEELKEFKVPISKLLPEVD